MSEGIEAMLLDLDRALVPVLLDNALYPQPDRERQAMKIEEYDPAREYPDAWGALDNEGNYRAQVVNAALRAQDIAQIEETIRRGWLAPECKAFDNALVADWCAARGLHLSAAYLIGQNFPYKFAMPLPEPPLG